MEKKAFKEEQTEPQSHTRCFLSRLDPGDDHRKREQGARAIRGHWGIENKNHYKRDTCQWREDDHRHRRVNAAQNLALTRNALLAIIPFDEKSTLSSMLEDFQNDRVGALNQILHASPIYPPPAKCPDALRDFLKKTLLPGGGLLSFSRVIFLYVSQDL